MTTDFAMESSYLLREVVREYVRSQRLVADCADTKSTAECHILTELLRLEHATQQELANRLLLDKAWVSRGVDRLVEANLVERIPDPNDKRRVQLSLSSAGYSEAAALNARLNAHAASLLEGLSPAEDGQLAGLLTQVLDKLRKGRCAPRRGCGSKRGVYRRADARDWPAIEALLLSASLPVVDARHHIERFTVGFAGSELVAVGGFECRGTDALLRSFVIANSARGQVQGGMLLRQVLRDAEAAGARKVHLLTETAAPFFARHGFKPVERRDAPEAIRSAQEFSQLCPRKRFPDASFPFQP